MEPYRVALIEDNEDHVFLIKHLLEEQEEIGEIRVFKNAEKALSAITGTSAEESFKPNFILVDLKLPRMSGQEFLSKLRDSLSIEKLPIFVLTSSDRMEERRQCQNLGALGYFVKPLGERHVQKIFRRLQTA
jgi:two-component system response regulator